MIELYLIKWSSDLIFSGNANAIRQREGVEKERRIYSRLIYIYFYGDFFLQKYGQRHTFQRGRTLLNVVAKQTLQLSYPLVPT